MGAADIASLPAREMLAGYRRKTLSPVEVVRVALARIERYNGVVNAYCHVDAEGALRGARDSEARWMAGAPKGCLLYTSPSPRDGLLSRMPSSA